MKSLILLLCLIGCSVADNQAEASEMLSSTSSSSSSKITASKSPLNAIPSAPGQKTTLLHSIQTSQQPQTQYIPQYVVQKQVPVPQQPAAMFIIAQPSPQGTHGPLFQQAVQQLLSYYNNNPQAKYQLLQQQQGGQISVPQNQPVYHQQPAFPSGALHVIPSPQLENTNVQPVHSEPAGVPNQQSPQATYVIPAQSLQTLSTLSPGLLSQLTGQTSTQQQIPVPVQFSPHQIVPQSFPAQLSSNHFITQQIPQFAQQISAAQLTLAPQFSGFPAQTAIPANIQIGGSAPAQTFSTKQTQSGNEFVTQTEKSYQSSASSNYNPVYRTAYVKG